MGFCVEMVAPLRADSFRLLRAFIAMHGWESAQKTTGMEQYVDTIAALQKFHFSIFHGAKADALRELDARIQWAIELST